MTNRTRRTTVCLLLLLLCNTACDSDCDERCGSDYDHCLSRAQDDLQRGRCDAEFDQCRGICAAESNDQDWL